MTTYKAPTDDYAFLLEHLFDYSQIASLPGFTDADFDTVKEVMPEAARFFEQELAPTNLACDQEGSHLVDGKVKVPGVIEKIHPSVVESGWLGLGNTPEYGGSGFPNVVNLAVYEMMISSNVSYSLMPILTQGVIRSLETYGSEEQKNTYLSKLISCEWSGTMNLTEANAGSDLSGVATKAVPAGDHYKLFGQKIYISWGDTELTDNVIQLVLARTPDAPEGTRGISMFIVPKYLVNPDGSLGERNDVKAISTEHKMGIHTSPTCVMQYGDNDGAVGYLVGEENKGLMYMFAVMNHARLMVGHQGIGVAERAFQQALAYSKDRIQGAIKGQKVPIVAHEDVRRMLMEMRALTESARAMSFYAIACEDRVSHGVDEQDKKDNHLLVDILTPLVKSWGTETAIEITSQGVQVHGGMGYIEETGAAQHLRDCRIFAIYEGTNGIQALDFIGRKCQRDGGEGLQLLLKQIADFAAGSKHEAALTQAADQCREALTYVLANTDQAPAVAFDFMMLFCNTLAGGLMAASHKKAQALKESGGNSVFCDQKMATADFFVHKILPRNHAYLAGVLSPNDLGDWQQWMEAN